jgi:glutamine amidotransferase
MIAIVDYKAGNLTSVRLALQALQAEAQITNDPDVIRKADRIIFPGVGAAGAAMKEVNQLRLRPALVEFIESGRPFLGICVGTQILLECSEENGGTPCLGIIPGEVKRFRPKSHYDKIPQMGWNAVHFTRNHPVFEGIEDNSEFYFVHSYYPDPSFPEHSLGETDYADVTFSSILGRDNLIATQFHPERSGRIGLALLNNFCKWDGTC